MNHRDTRMASATAVTVLVAGLLLEPAVAGRTQAVEPTSCEEGPRPSETIFDTQGVEFGPWFRRLVNQVSRHRHVPAEHSTTVGCAVVSFRVHHDGTISDVVLKNPSLTPALSEASRQALVDASPVEPLPQRYPDEFISVTSTFYYNMSPRRDSPEVAVPKP